MEKMTGIKPSDILGKGNYEYSFLIYHERRPMIIDLILAPDDRFEKDRYLYTLRDTKMLTAESTFEKPDGTQVHMWGKASRLFDKDGNLTGAIESIRDITERRRAEEALRVSEERYRRIVETADEGIWQMDVNFDTVYVNRRMADMLGYTPEGDDRSESHLFQGSRGCARLHPPGKRAQAGKKRPLRAPIQNKRRQDPVDAGIVDPLDQLDGYVQGFFCDVFRYYGS